MKFEFIFDDPLYKWMRKLDTRHEEWISFRSEDHLYRVEILEKPTWAYKELRVWKKNGEHLVDDEIVGVLDYFYPDRLGYQHYSLPLRDDNGDMVFEDEPAEDGRQLVKLSPMVNINVWPVEDAPEPLWRQQLASHHEEDNTD